MRWIPTLLAVLSAISSASASPAHATWQRDWKTYPAVIEMPGYTGDLYVNGDVHGSFDEYFKILHDAGLITGTVDDYHWAGGDASFVQLGDIIDKGDDSLDVLDLLMDLQQEASASGGHVIVVAGNHEMNFLAAPWSHKSKAFRNEIVGVGLDVYDDVYSPDSDYGAWFRDLPAAALINGIFLSHSGWSAGQDVAGIARLFADSVTSENWDNAFTCGDHDADSPTPGFFNANIWWGAEGDELASELNQLGAVQVIFGHDPHAFLSTGQIDGYFGDDDGHALIKTDVGLVNGDSRGEIFRCRKWRAAGGCRSPEILSRDDRHAFGPLRIHRGPPPRQDVPTPRSSC